MTSSIETEGPDAKAVLRLLNGPLCGCEYHLRDGATLVVAGAANDLLGSPETQDGEQPASMPVFPEHTIVVPMEGGRNFEVIIDDNARDGFRLRTLDPEVEESVQDYQEICHVGTLAFAVRPPHEEWADGIVNALPTPPIEENDRRRRVIWFAKILVGVIAVFALTASGLYLWNKFKSDKRVADAASVIAGATEQYRVLNGRDGAIYIFAKNERDASWARQAMSRQGMIGSARISTLRFEEARINQLLQASFPSLAFHRLKLGDPEKPVLVLSQERGQISSQMRKSLTASLNDWMPYAQSIDIISWSDAMLDAQAKRGLDQIGVDYERVANAGSVTYTVQKGLSDIDLARLQEFTEGFYRDFGTRFIYFSVALKDDPFKGKSYKYGGPGYIKLTQHHWFFPQTFK